MSHRQTLAIALVLLTFFVISDLAYAGLLDGRDEYTQETSHTITIQPDGQIGASTPDGHITVEAWDGKDVSLVITKRVRTRRGAASAESYFAKMDVDINKSSSNLEIIGDVPNHAVGYGFSIDYEMKVPADVGLELRTSDGAVRVHGVYGNVYARSSDGDISVNEIGEAELRTSDGNIRADAIEGDVSAITSDGDIRITNVGGDANIRSSDGDIDCREVRGLVVVQLSDGDARMQAVHGGVSARSSDGVLIVRDAAGPVELKTSDGDIELSLAQPIPMSRVTCTTSDGNIRLNLEETAAFTIAAKTSDGRVNIDLPGKYERDEKSKRVEGHVNGGGPAVRLRTSDGSITIEKT